MTFVCLNILRNPQVLAIQKVEMGRIEIFSLPVCAECSHLSPLDGSGSGSANAPRDSIDLLGKQPVLHLQVGQSQHVFIAANETFMAFFWPKVVKGSLEDVVVVGLRIQASCVEQRYRQHVVYL